MPYVAVGDLRMFYEEHGRRDGLPLLFLHGFSGTGATMWGRQLALFGEQYRLLVPDLRGHGQTGNPGGLAAMNHRQFGRDVAAFCRALGVERAIFCGESTGAMLLLTLGLEAPELAAALVLSGGTYFYGPEIRAWWATQTPESLLASRPDQEAYKARHVSLGPDHWRFLGEAFIALGTHAHSEDFPEAEELKGIAAPTLIMHGDRDWFFPVAVPSEVYRLIPGSELCILPNTGHVPPMERTDWFNYVVLDFLGRRVG